MSNGDAVSNPATGPRLTELEIGDEPEAWAAAGFAVVDGSTQVGHVRLRFSGASEPRGIKSWAFDYDVADVLDGVLTRHVDAPDPATATDHPNGVNHFDHVVLMSPDCDRTVSALAAIGLAPRRTREYEMKGTLMRQTFFWMGEVILELVGEVGSHEPGPATLWGLAFTTDDIDATVASLGERSSEARTAVQPGRKIASLRHRDLDITVPVAFMTPHVKSA